jgi:hypothetical protein
VAAVAATMAPEMTEPQAVVDWLFLSILVVLLLQLEQVLQDQQQLHQGDLRLQPLLLAQEM